MSDRAEMTERHGRILAELAELGLGSARDLQQRQLAAETPKDAAVLASALHRISRSVRQCLALEARLERDARRQEIEDRDDARAETERRVGKRRDRIKAAVERLVWTEYEDSEANVLVDDLDMLLDQEELSDSFCADPVDTHIARICRELGLPNPPLQGEVWPKATEGVEAHASPNRPASQPIGQSLRDSSSSGGASGGADHPWPSSA